ncbi:MAG: integrase core domain-containing protein, partial [Alphaproteobacteria bacterium]
SFENGKEARTTISEWLQHYNVSRPHSTFNGRTPSEVYLYHKIFPSTGLAQSDWKLAA